MISDNSHAGSSNSPNSPNDPPFVTEREKPSPNRLNAILAGNYSEFLKWCRHHKIPAHDRKRVVYVSSAEVLLGLRGYLLIVTGNWFQRKDIEEIKKAHQRLGNI